MAAMKRLLSLTTEDSSFIALCRDLYEKTSGSFGHDVYAQSKNLLLLFGSGAVISASFLIPHAGASSAKEYAQIGSPRDRKEWEKFNTGYLKQSINRLLDQGYLEHSRVGSRAVIGISESGKQKVLSFVLEKGGPVKGKTWDGRWRMVLYDIDAKLKTKQQGIRKALKALGFIQLQRSVYIIPYDCREQVSFIRSYFGLGVAIQYIEVLKFEDDVSFRRHFGL